MPENSKTKTPRKFIALGYYQIAGGIIGMVMLISFILDIASFNSLLLVIILPALSLFLFSIYCGILLLKNKERGLQLSLINQLFQLISFAFAGYAYQYASGVFLSVGLNLTDSFSFTFFAGISAWKLNINTDSTEYLLSFNLVALYLIILISRMKKEIQKAKELAKIEDLGQINI